MNYKIYTIDEIKERFEKVARKYGIDEAYLFGSYARGEATKKSDVDFYIGKGKIRGLQLGGFYSEVRDALDKNIDLITTSTILDDEFEEELKKDLVKIYG